MHFPISIISKLTFFDIDKLPIVSEMPIYRLSIIFDRYIAHPYRRVSFFWKVTICQPRKSRKSSFKCIESMSLWESHCHFHFWFLPHITYFSQKYPYHLTLNTNNKFKEPESKSRDQILMASKGGRSKGNGKTLMEERSRLELPWK